MYKININSRMSCNFRLYFVRTLLDEHQGYRSARSPFAGRWMCCARLSSAMLWLVC